MLALLTVVHFCPRFSQPAASRCIVNMMCCVDACTVGGFPVCPVVPQPRVVSTESSDAHPDVLTPIVTRRLLSALSVQSVPRPPLQGTMVAAPSPG